MGLFSNPKLTPEECAHIERRTKEMAHIKSQLDIAMTAARRVEKARTALEEAERELKRCRAVREIKETPPPRRSFFKMVFGRHDQ